MNIEELKKQLDEVIERLEKVEEQLKMQPISMEDFADTWLCTGTISGITCDPEDREICKKT